MRGRDAQYAPAMHVLIQQRVPPPSRRYLEQMHAGADIVWDEPSLSTETWTVYAGITSGVAQVVRLLGKQLEFDRWGGARRISLATLPWEGLPYGFGWKVACRPFAGVQFVSEPQDLSPVSALAYVRSWPHGYLTLDELRRFRGPLAEDLVATLTRAVAGDEHAQIAEEEVAELLQDPRSLDQGSFAELFGFGDSEDIWTWRTRRALILLRAMDGALEVGKDLVCVGY